MMNSMQHILQIKHNNAIMVTLCRRCAPRHPLPGRSHFQQMRQRRNEPLCCMTLPAIKRSLLQRARYSALLPPPLTTTVLWPFFWDQPGEPVPEENFWTLWCKGILAEADTTTIRLGATPSGLTSTHLHHPS